MEQPVDHANELLHHADALLLAHYGVDCATLLAPIGANAPQGELLRGTARWQAIRRARESDDASLPLGAWVRRLKRAEWAEVARASLDAMATRTKDLQLAVWLAEALLHEHGFAGLAAGTVVIDGLLERYWDTLYPSRGGHAEHRTNLLHWFNEKLLAPVRLVPITGCAEAAGAEDGIRTFAWADCEHLRHRQKTGAAASEPLREGGAQASDVDADEFAAAVAATPDDLLRCKRRELAQALLALERLDTTIERCFEDDAPSVGALHDLLETIDAFVAAELRRRGVSVDEARADDDKAGAVHALSSGCHAAQAGGAGEANAAAVAAARNAAAVAMAGATAGAVSRNDVDADALAVPGCEPTLRMRAYAQLAEAAAVLAELEPHSPVPYLVRKAVQWGTLNTAQLFEEIFVQRRGRLNVFEMLGIALPETTEDAQ